MSEVEKRAGETKQELGMRLLLAKKTLELMSGAFALVAALAWNDAIQSLFKLIFGEQSSLLAKFAYALLVTGIIVWMSVRISKLTKALEPNE